MLVATESQLKADLTLQSICSWSKKCLIFIIPLHFRLVVVLTPVFKLCTLFTTKEYQTPPGRVNGRLADREVEVIGWKPPQQAAIERRSD